MCAIRRARPRQLAGAQIVRLDLADDAQVAAAAASVPRLDCLVNNAGFALNGPFGAYSAEQMRHQMQVNVLGPALLTQQLLPALAVARGRVINISSVAGELGMPMNALYCATKFALEGLSESLRHELATRGVQVALVEPGGFRTAFARNMVWGEVPLPAAGRDARQLAAYRKMQERLLARPGKDPAAVVRAVLRLVEMEIMPMRTRVGMDARGASLLRRLLPERLALGLVGALFRRQLAAEEGE